MISRPMTCAKLIPFKPQINPGHAQGMENTSSYQQQVQQERPCVAGKKTYMLGETMMR